MEINNYINEMTLKQRTDFAVLCALEIYQEESFASWADKWLSGEDCSKQSALAVHDEMMQKLQDIIDQPTYSVMFVAMNATYAAASINDQSIRDITIFDALCWIKSFIKRNKINIDMISIAKKAMEVK